MLPGKTSSGNVGLSSAIFLRKIGLVEFIGLSPAA